MSGFVPLPSPNNFIQPGSVVNHTTKPVENVGLICYYTNLTFGLPLIDSPTTEQEQTWITKAEAKLTASATKIVSGSFNLTNFHEARVSLENTHIRTYPTGDLRKNIRERVGPDCRCAVRDYLAARSKVEVPSAVLVADLDYNLLDSRGLSLSVSNDVLERLRGKLGVDLSAGHTSTNHIHGTNLVVGYFADPQLLTYFEQPEKLEIRGIELLDETPYRTTSTGAVITNLLERPNDTFILKNRTNLHAAVGLVVEGFVIRGTNEAALHFEVQMQDSGGRVLSKRPLARDSKFADDWKRTPIARAVGQQQFEEHFRLAEYVQRCERPFPKVILLDEFKAEEVPVGTGRVSVTVKDLIGHQVATESVGLETEVREEQTR